MVVFLHTLSPLDDLSFTNVTNSLPNGVGATWSLHLTSTKLTPFISPLGMSWLALNQFWGGKHSLRRELSLTSTSNLLWLCTFWPYVLNTRHISPEIGSEKRLTLMRWRMCGTNFGKEMGSTKVDDDGMRACIHPHNQGSFRLNCGIPVHAFDINLVLTYFSLTATPCVDWSWGSNRAVAKELAIST